MNTRGAGRPVNRLELHLNDISKFKQDVLSVCQNKNTKDKITELIESLRRDLVDTSDDAPDVTEILELISQLSKNDQEEPLERVPKTKTKILRKLQLNLREKILG